MINLHRTKTQCSYHMDEIGGILLHIYTENDTSIRQEQSWVDVWDLSHVV